MKKFFYLLLVFLLNVESSCTDETEKIDHEPIIIENEYFSYILYDGLSQNILEPIQNKLEENYSRILNDLGEDAMGKVSVNIWNDESTFLADMQNSLGVSYPGAGGWIRSAYDIRILYQGNVTDQNVLHEFCHCVSMVVNPQIANNPRWLWEAVAIYESNEFIEPQTINYLVEGDFPTIAELNSDFNGGDREIYRVGYLLSEYIIFKWGNESYVNLIKSNGNILQTLEITTEEFEEGWKSFVIEKYFKK